MTRFFSLFLLCCALWGQSTSTSSSTSGSSILPFNLSNLPPLYTGGVSYNETKSPRLNFWLNSDIPLSNQAGVYLSTSVDLIPISYLDSNTNRQIYSLQPSGRIGVLKTLYRGKSNMVLVGVDAGGALLSAGVSGSGVSVNLTTAGSVEIVHQFSPHIALVVPIRAFAEKINNQTYWPIVPEIGLVWKP